VKSHLWIGDDMPPEMIELWLARDVYHTWPLPDAMTVARHLVILGAEAEVKRRENGHK